MKTKLLLTRLLLMVLCHAGLTDAIGADVIDNVVPPGVLFELLALNKDLPTPEKPKYNSPCAMVPSHDGKLLYIAQQTAKRIDVYAIEAKTIVSSIYLPDEVTGLAIAPAKMELYATCSSEQWSAGKTCVINLESGKVRAVIATGWGSCAPVVHPEGTLLFVCNRFSNDVSMVNLTSLTETKRIAVSREPSCAAITPDGTKLVVGNRMPDNLSVDTNTICCKISLIDANSGTLLKHIRLVRGGKSVQDAAVSADGRFAFVTHLTGKFNMVMATCAAGWTMTNNISVIDLLEEKCVNTVCLDLSTIGMGNPWGVTCSDDGKMMVVSHAGCNRLSVIRYNPFIDSVTARTERGIDLQNNFTTLVGARVRIPLMVENPRDVVIIGNSVFAAGYFSDSLVQMSIPDINDESTWTIEYIPFGKAVPQTAERKGKQLFYDSEICFQSWLSCYSCHSDGRQDGFNWILGGGAKQYPKNTRGLLHSWWTPPTTWAGRRGSAAGSIRAAIELKLFQAPTESVAQQLDSFCMNLRAVQSPYLVKGRLSPAAQRGKKLFNNNEDANCVACHSGMLFTDNKGWNTTVTDPYDANPTWITPHLREAWRSPPYGHIGSIATVREMIDAYMKSYSSRVLTATEIDELAEYVLSL